jgi:hypothetical protein
MGPQTTYNIIEISLKWSSLPSLWVFLSFPQPLFQPLNNVICKVIKLYEMWGIKCWNSRINAQSSKIFIAAVHNSSSSDWLKALRNDKKTGSNSIWWYFEFQSPFKPSVLFFSFHWVFWKSHPLYDQQLIENVIVDQLKALLVMVI